MSKPKLNLNISGKDLVLSFQHMFAMLGATITVPIVTGMSIPLALLSAGVGTLIFYFLTKRKVPVFLGSSFAFMPGLLTIFSQGASYNAASLSAMISLVLAGVVYMLLALVIKLVGASKVKKLFPPIVVGPVIIVIGMNLAGSIFWNDIIVSTIKIDEATGALSSSPDAWKYWTTAIITAISIIAVNAFAKPKSFLKVIPILIGFVVGYIYGMCVGLVDFNPASEHFIFAETAKGNVVIFQMAADIWGFWGAWGELDGSLIATAIVSIVPIAVVTFMEHLGDISANSTVCGRDFMTDPGLHRTVLGDGIATAVSGLLGGPANTTYGENTAVLAITKNYNPRNVALAACWAVFLGIFVPVGELIKAIPTAVVGGACVVLFGMISANGLRALVDGKVDFSNSKNMLVVSITMSVGLGLGAVGLAGDIVSALSGYTLNGNLLKIGFATSGGGFVSISALAIATILAIVLNLVIPNSKESSEEARKAYDSAMVTLEANVVDFEPDQNAESTTQDTTDSTKE